MSSKKANRPDLRLIHGGQDAAPEVSKAFTSEGLVPVELPEDEKELLKEVPAKVDGTVVGKALLYNDGSVDLMIDPDAPAWAVEKIKNTENEMLAYSRGVDDGISGQE